ncbi:acetyl-CoA carboxylase biotin carboxylase subunit [Polyangium jinanense]|uniref:Biotin carboxylase n=1 Tax=Polyangium jinanense TaxID=2829994 RepID=A0A9X3XDW0_9BACT|nr:acetyl-CoA carboxylase biotin carboxylase subunit [Polyangium jinanense]MDC3957748.1 acetyl-CoA carboxylase biotin carboxylase subunit [Polyangium jinanense]MDC3987540.1 acetyl-CoA carboxylase biotin carboxylase subunit [Polyangium jinanense]
MFGKILIANRGEIAMRILRACRTLGIRAVAIHSDVDASAPHVRFADEAVCVGPADPRRSYLNIPQIIAAAEITGADAVHPGYGFLSENAEFADLCRRCGLTFIGPTPEAMRLWGDKVRAREAAKRFGLPLLPGTTVLRDGDDAAAQAAVVGYPVILKAAGGGGGRGMRVVRDESEIRRAFETATSEALAGFKNPDVYLEKFVEEPRHIELQVLGDNHGHIFTFGERECSLQRRHQKIIEEAPSPAMTPEKRAELSAACTRALVETGYTSLGTLEFLMDERGNLYFMEMNTRVQVEHPVTEMVTGIDLVENQIRAAVGESLNLPSGRALGLRGHAMECRINAEDPRTFVPWPGLITEYLPPGGGGVRVESGVYGGFRVPNNYDPMLAKVITHGATRAEAIARMRSALDEFIIGGIRTNIPLHQALLRDPDVVAGKMSTRTIERLRF